MQMRLTRVERIVTRNACFFFLVMILRGGIIIGGAIRKVSAQTGSGVWTTSTCQATGKAAVKVDCAYASPSAIRGSEERKAPQILLSHAVITFQPVHESHMQTS